MVLVLVCLFIAYLDLPAHSLIPFVSLLFSSSSSSRERAHRASVIVLYQRESNMHGIEVHHFASPRQSWIRAEKKKKKQ